MESIETLIPDNEGNHLVVVLYFYDDRDKDITFRIPDEFSNIDIADININKLYLDRPLKLRAFFRMSKWLLEQIQIYPNAVFSFICSTDPLEHRHHDIQPERYRWELFKNLQLRYQKRLDDLKICTEDIIVGPTGNRTYARIYYRQRHSPVIHIVTSHLKNKYSSAATEM